MKVGLALLLFVSGCTPVPVSVNRITDKPIVFQPADCEIDSWPFNEPPKDDSVFVRCSRIVNRQELQYGDTHEDHRQ